MRNSFLIASLVLFALALYFYFKAPISSAPKPIIRKVPSATISPEPIVKPLTLDTIFTLDHSWTQSLPSEHTQILLATGDVLLARTVNYKTVTMNNFLWPFEKTAEFLKTADLSYINLEGPLVNNCPPTNEGMIFCGDPHNIAGLQFAGIDIVNIANNHAGNWGADGVNETVAHLEQAGMTPVGHTNPVVIKNRGLTFAFLGYNEVDQQPGVALADPDRIKTEVNVANEKADIVIVQFHWGTEYTTSITDNQKILAHLAIDSGADLIIGNHPHWIQPVEIYNNRLITYAHGNFVMDQEWSLETKLGVIGRYTFYKDQLIDAEFFPIRIEEFGQPQLLTGESREKILTSIKFESEHLMMLR